MTEKKDVREQKPFMYIVQPKLMPPKTIVQSEVRIKKTHHDEIIEVEDLQGPLNTLPEAGDIPAEQDLEDHPEDSPQSFNSEQELPATVDIINAEELPEVMDKIIKSEELQPGEEHSNEISEINVISIAKDADGHQTLEGETHTDNESTHTGIESLDRQEETEQINFTIVHSNEAPDNPADTEPAREPRRKLQKKFTDMSSDELLEYLIRIPRIVPKPLCEMKVNGRIIRGQIEKKKGDTIYIRPTYGRNLISATKEDIEYITFLTF